MFTFHQILISQMMSGINIIRIVLKLFHKYPPRTDPWFFAGGETGFHNFELANLTTTTRSNWFHNQRMLTQCWLQTNMSNHRCNMNILACCVVQTIQEVVFSVLMSEILVFYLYLTFICVLECIVNAYSLLNFLQLRVKRLKTNELHHCG